MDRREFLKKSALAGAGLTLTSLGWPPTAWGGNSMKWGALAETEENQNLMTALTALETKVGRRFATAHARIKWETSLVNTFTTWSVDTGHVPIISWFSRKAAGGAVRWSSIASGAHDSWIEHQAKTIKRAEWHAYIAFHKEPEDDTWIGTSAEYRAAHERIRHIFSKVGAKNLRWIVTLMASTYRVGQGAPRSWLPATYDILGVDGYNRYRYADQPWKTFTDVFGAAHNCATRKGKPLYVQEYGCVEGEPGWKAAWIRDATEVLKTWPEVVGVSYNNESGESGLDAGCDYRLDTSSSSLSAFKAMGEDPRFQG